MNKKSYYLFHDSFINALTFGSIFLYIFQVLHIIPDSFLIYLFWINLIIDCIFCADIAYRTKILGKHYLNSPWFIIDLLSAIPIFTSIFELFQVYGLQEPSIRFFRAIRLTRLLRISRVLKINDISEIIDSLRAEQGLGRLNDLINNYGKTPNFDKALKFSVIILIITFISVVYTIEEYGINNYKSQLKSEIKNLNSIDEINKIEGFINKEDTKRYRYFTLEKVINNEHKTFYFSNKKAIHQSEFIEGVIVILIMVLILLIGFITNNLAFDQKSFVQKNILNRFFSPPLVLKLHESPEIMNRFYRQWVSVFFIDIHGFTKESEKNKDDIESLALKLRKIMDIGYKEIVISHKGVLDKFIGDAIMGWIGGSVSDFWELMIKERDELYLDKIEIVKQDIKTINRSIKSLNKKELVNLKLEKEVLLDSYLEKQKKNLSKKPKLLINYEKAFLKYKKQVAKSSVLCCLNIWQEIINLNDKYFNHLKIGISSGYVMLGNFGSSHQISFTALGHTVNEAARLEPASFQCGCKILIDEDTYNLIKDDIDFVFKKLMPIKLKGMSKKLLVYEPLIKTEKNKKFTDKFNQAVKYILEKNYEEAIKTLINAEKIINDNSIKILIKKSQEAIKSKKDFTHIVISK